MLKRCPLQWREKHENMFPTVGFCARQILKIVGPQIEIEIIFSLVEFLLVLGDAVYNQKI